MIRYKKYQNQTKSTPLSGKWLARAVADETLDTRALAEHMAKHNTPYSQGAIHGVLKDMTSCIKELLLDGKNVKLDDLAIFGVGIRGKPADTSKDWSVTTNVVGLRLKCRATGTLAINQLKLEAQLKELTTSKVAIPAVAARRNGRENFKQSTREAKRDTNKVMCQKLLINHNS